MALNAQNARLAVTGGVFKGTLGSTAPTGTSGAPAAAYADLGYLSGDGVQIEMPDAGDAEVERAWQNGDVLRTIRQPSEDAPRWTFTMKETKREVIETYFGVTVTQTATEGNFKYKASAIRQPSAYVIDYVDGSEITRDYIPRGTVVEVGELKQNGEEVIGYEVTMEGEYDSASQMNFQRWSTALRTSA